MTAEPQAAPRPQPPTRAPEGRPAPRLSGNITTAILLATAPADVGGPAALLPWEDGTLVGRLAAQLAEMGLMRTHVLTRPEWEDDVRRAVETSAAQATVEVCGSPSADLARVAALAREARGGLVVAHADLVTHRGALEGLLASPGVITGALGTAGAHGAPFAFRARTARGRMVSASSAYHAVAAPRTSFLGVVKVGEADADTLADVAGRLAELTAAGPPADWQRELQHKEEGWRLSVARSVLRAERRAARLALEEAGRSPDELPAIAPEEYGERRRALARELPEAEDAELRLRRAAAEQDVAALLLVGLVRSGVHVGNSFVRRLFWARPLTRAAAERAAEDIQDYDEDRVLLDSAVKATDGFFTTFFVSTWSRYVARWAARRGLTPNQVTVIALCIGIAAAAAFATGERAGYVIGAVLLYLSFVADCVDGQLARYTRRFSKFGAWLDSVFDRAKEYVAFAGLAIGAGSGEVWVLAAATLTLQSLRHAFDFSYGATDRQAIAETPQPPVEQAPDEAAARNRMKARGTLDARLGALEPRPADQAGHDEDQDEAPREEGRDRRPLARRVLGSWRLLDRYIPGLVWLKRMVAFPIGERFAVICLTAALATPHTTFVVLLAWGGFALVYTSIGRVLRTIAQWRAIAR